MSQTYKIGIDLGGTRVKTGLIKGDEIVISNVFDVDSNRELKRLLPKLEKDILSFYRGDIRIEGIGVAFPGIVDTSKGQVIDTSSKYTDASTVDLVRWAEERFQLCLKMENDARLACLGEWQCGAGKGTSDMIMLALGTGIGTAAIIDGKLLRGKHFQAGILGGHFIVDFNNKTDKCSCGRYGCLEGIGSMWMIEKKAKQSPLFATSLLTKASKNIDWELILELSERGDKLSRLLKLHCLKVWGAGLVNLIHAYDPERIVIGGGVSHAENIILPYFKEFLEKRAWCPGGIPEIKIAEFPDTAALLGAASLFDKLVN